MILSSSSTFFGRQFGIGSTGSLILPSNIPVEKHSLITDLGSPGTVTKEYQRHASSGPQVVLWSGLAGSNTSQSGASVENKLPQEKHFTWLFLLGVAGRRVVGILVFGRRVVAVTVGGHLSKLK